MISRCRYLTSIFIILILSGSCSLFIPSHHKTEEYTPIFAAALDCDLPVVQQGVKQDPSILKATEWEGVTLLHDAVAGDCTDETEFLLDVGADVNARKDDGVTPLHIAARNGNVIIIEILIKHGANINAVDSKGWTPLDRAEKWGQQNAASFLRSHGGQKNTNPNQRP